MSITLIEDLAYKLKKGKENSNRAIVFLGAGASTTGGIPLAGELMAEILKRYAEVPAVRRLSVDDKKSYTKVMSALDPVDRKKLFKNYIDKANINASHIYLAHMMAEGYIDFVFTVNFDNLMQRALGLFNMYPAVYDMAVLKGMTTAPFESPGIVYLHGQHHGFNLLNTEQEFKSVSKLLSRCFDSVANRPWIVAGYSGEDPVLDYINDLGRFEYGLYWVCYKDKAPTERVSKCFFSGGDKNAFRINGCDADSFFVKLHAELGLPQPPIIDTPFSYLKGLQESIVDIDGDELKTAKERLRITKRWISQAITTYEKAGDVATPDMSKVEVEKIQKSLIDIIITEKYEQLPDFLEYAMEPSLKESLATGYYNWGTSLNEKGQVSVGEDSISYYQQAIEKFEKAIELQPNDAFAYNNWGYSLNNLGQASTGDAAVKYYQQAISKCEKAIELKPDYVLAYNNWGYSLNNLGQLSVGADAVKYYQQAIEKYEKATGLKPDDADVYVNWGNSLDNLGQASTGDAAVKYYQQAISKCEKAIELKPDYADAYNNWGISLNNLGRASSGADAVKYYQQAIEKYEKAIELKPDDAGTYNNWGNSLDNLGQASSGEEAVKYYQQATEKYEKAISLKSDYAFAYNNWGVSLNNLGQTSAGADAVKYYQQAIEKFEKAIGLKPDYALAYNNWGNLLDNLGQASAGADAIKYYQQAIEKYENALSLNSDYGLTYDNCCATILRMSYLLQDNEKTTILHKALEMGNKAYELVGKSYNLSCCYALLNDSSNAFKYLEEALQKGKITFAHVEEDEDWEQLRTHPEYLRLREQYKGSSVVDINV